MKRLLVTGVPGWLTTALLHSLAADPLDGLTEVRCLTMPGTKPPSLPSGQLRFTQATGRLEDPATLAAACKDCDAILHAAGVLHVRRTGDWYKVNTEGTSRLLAAAAAAGVRRFVLVSTNAAAGRAAHRRQLLTEADVPRPLSHYGRSKLLAEQAVIASQLEGVVLRPCMFYGPPVPDRHIDIYRRILAGRMPMIGTGDYARSVTHIDNLVQGCRRALTKPGIARQTYYIADARTYTTREVIEAMARALDCTARYWHLPRVVSPLAYFGDRALAALGFYWQDLHLVGEADWHVGVSIEKARQELGYMPTASLDEGMKAAVSWCRQGGWL